MQRGKSPNPNPNPKPGFDGVLSISAILNRFLPVNLFLPERDNVTFGYFFFHKSVCLSSVVCNVRASIQPVEIFCDVSSFLLHFVS